MTCPPGSIVSRVCGHLHRNEMITHNPPSVESAQPAMQVLY